MTTDHFLNSIRTVFRNYQSLGEKTMEQLTDDQLFWQYNAESNSIAIIVNHLWGNMMSRWTDFLSADGEKEWRQRDLEFEAVIQNREELMAKWAEGWECLFKALDSVNESNFDTTVYIRSQGHSIPEALHRQLAHYASHIGQMMYIAKMLAGNSWTSLSIPKGESQAFNQQMFGGKKGSSAPDEGES